MYAFIYLFLNEEQVQIIFVVINIMPQMLSTEHNL